MQIQVLNLSEDNAIETFYSHLNQVKRNGSGYLELDLSHVDFVTPNGVLALVAAIRLWKNWYGEKVIFHNLGYEVSRYLERVNFFSYYGSDVLLNGLSDLDVYQRSNRSKSLMELCEFSPEWAQNAQDVAMAVDHAANILVAAYGSIERCGHILTMFSEIAANIPHSQDKGFGLIQKYNDRVNLQQRVIIAVSDLGIGIQKSLQTSEYYQPSHNAKRGSDYIKMALQSGVTSRPVTEHRGGLGLHSVDSEVRRVSGTLRIRSGQSALYKSPAGIVVLDHLAPFPGTQVTITVKDPGNV